MSRYSPCDTSSWAVPGVAKATASSPYAVPLFHDGSYLGTATAVQYPFSPTVTRIADDQISITYVVPQSNEYRANPTGRATAQFRWSPPERRSS